MLVQHADDYQTAVTQARDVVSLCFAMDVLFSSSGTEDYFQSAFYFDGGRFQFPEAGLTHLNYSQVSVLWASLVYVRMSTWRCVCVCVCVCVFVSAHVHVCVCYPV